MIIYRPLTGECIVARVVSPDATAQQCQNRYQRTLDPTLKRGGWSPAEDAKLHLAVSAYGNSWVDVAVMMEGRNNEQCRDRWNERLDPSINRDAWTGEEDALLIGFVGELGESKWKAVSEKIGNGRKDSAVGDRWVLRSRPRMLTCKIQCRARYETLKKGKAKATTSMGEGSTSRPPYRQGDEEDETPGTTRPTPRKRAPVRGKGKCPETPLPEKDSTQPGDKPTQLSLKKPRGRPPKVAQIRDETEKRLEGRGSNTGRVQRPTPRKRGRPPKVKPREASPARDCPGPEEEQNT